MLNAQRHRPTYLTKNRYDAKDVEVRGLSALQRLMRIEYLTIAPSKRRPSSW
jgi:hypothetical protein